MLRSHEDTHAANKAADQARERRKAEIRRLNDQLRTEMTGGLVMITPGVRSLASDVFAMVIRKVSRFADFNPDNDPHDEHDFGAIEVAGIRVFFKLDCYDKSLEWGSPDPADPAVTTRVLTVMLASEY